jgi:hypothetical protein
VTNSCPLSDPSPSPFHVQFFSPPSCLLYILAQKSVQQQRLL